MKKQVEDWILLADNDLYAAEIIIKDDYPKRGISSAAKNLHQVYRTVFRYTFNLGSYRFLAGIMLAGT
jgi:hypothetical protein